MTRRTIGTLLWAFLIALLVGPPVQAVGIVTVTTGGTGSLRLYTIAWTANGSGAVSGNGFTIPRSTFVQAKFVPGSGGTQPSDDYDVTLLDPHSVDVLGGLGANLSQTNAALITEMTGILEAGSYDLVVANAGSAKTGTVYLWMQ